MDTFQDHVLGFGISGLPFQVTLIIFINYQWYDNSWVIIDNMKYANSSKRLFSALFTIHLKEQEEIALPINDESELKVIESFSNTIC